MIPSASELFSALYGVWRIAHFDRRAGAYFNTSREGAIRSFFAAVLVAPMFAAMVALRYDDAAVSASPGTYVLVETIAYVVSWTLYPVVVETMTRLLGVRERFLAYLCVYNWAMVLQNGVIITLAIIANLAILPAGAGQLLALVALVFTAALLWFVARLGLGVPGSNAAGLVFLDILLSIAVNGIADSMV